MQQEKLILTAKAKAAKAYARAEELCLKLKAAIKASTGCNDITSPSLDTVHSHKKSKSTAGVSMASPVVQSHQYLSPQRKDTTINKRVSVQLPHHFPSRTLSPSPSLDSDSLSAGIPTIGSNSKDNDDKVVEVVKQPLQRGLSAKSCGGHRYYTPLQQGRTTSPSGLSGASSGSSCSTRFSKEVDSDN